MSRKDLGVSAIFGVPLLLGVLALIGLVGALLEDGPGDLIGSVLLAGSIAVVVWVRLRKQV